MLQKTLQKTVAKNIAKNVAINVAEKFCWKILLKNVDGKLQKSSKTSHQKVSLNIAQKLPRNCKNMLHNKFA